MTNMSPMHPACNPVGRLPRTSPAPEKACGFTLVELLVIIAIAAILGTLAAPSFKGTLDRWRVNQAKQAFSSSLFLARKEAIKHGGEILLASNCNTSNWGCGWQLCIASSKTSKTCGDSPEILQDVAALYSTNADASGARTYYRFNRWGHAEGLNALSMVFYPSTAADPSDSIATSTLCMASGGRIRFNSGKGCS